MDFSARTVISPDPNLRVDEVAVPVLVAKNMSYPERVTAHNIDMLRTAISNGTDVWPGANFVTHCAPNYSSNPNFAAFGPKKRYLKAPVARESALKDLKIGDIVERHLIDNECVPPATVEPLPLRLIVVSTPLPQCRPFQPPAKFAQAFHHVSPRKDQALEDLPVQRVCLQPLQR